MKTEDGLVLFDTCDLWITADVSAAKANKTLNNVVRVGDSVMIHGALIEKSYKVAYLATSVWLRSNMALTNKPPPSIPRASIHQDKIDIYHKVVESISNSIESFENTRPKNLNQHVIIWQRGSIKAVFFDTEWRHNGGLIAGIMQLPTGYGFFHSRTFANFNSVPNVGMEEYANVFPTCELEDGYKYGGFSFICTNMYGITADRRTCTVPSPEQLRDIISESTDLLASLIGKFGDLQEPPQFLR